MKHFQYLYLFVIISLKINHLNNYLFTVIMAIHNTGRFLDESIGSLLNQTIGYENIQIILVNDGSSDNSEKICLKYKNLYYLIKQIFKQK